MQKLLICTDLDRTLLPNGNQPESPEARSIFKRLVSCPDVCLVYVSGRNLTLIQEAIQEYDLPAPHWAVGDVGSTIYQLDGDRWKSWQSWSKEIAGDWQGLNAMDLEPLFVDLTEISHLILQEPDRKSVV